jgi:hypothetical protein
MIFDVYRNYWMRSQVRKSLLKSEVACSGWPKSALILYRLDEVSDLPEKVDWSTLLGMDKKRVTFVGYTPQRLEVITDNIVVLSKKSIGLLGGINEEAIKKVVDMPYELLINYFEKPAKELEFMSNIVQAAYKVGLGNTAIASSDLLIDVKVTAVADFNKELIKYLTILSKK